MSWGPPGFSYDREYSGLRKRNCYNRPLLMRIRREVFCQRCRLKVHLGQWYVRVPPGRGSPTKYYHLEHFVTARGEQILKKPNGGSL